jgi:hypothetical protein
MLNPKPKRMSHKTPLEWVSDTTTQFDRNVTGGDVYACQEKRCEPLPIHAHRTRPYLVWAPRLVHAKHEEGR